MDKRMAYVEGSLFLLFAKAEDDPCQAAERTALAIRGAVYSLYPRHRFENGIKMHRTQWAESYISELIVQLALLMEKEFLPKQNEPETA